MQSPGAQSAAEAAAPLAEPAPGKATKRQRGQMSAQPQQQPPQQPPAGLKPPAEQQRQLRQLRQQHHRQLSTAELQAGIRWPSPSEQPPFWDRPPRDSALTLGEESSDLCSAKTHTRSQHETALLKLLCHVSTTTTATTTRSSTTAAAAKTFAVFATCHTVFNARSVSAPALLLAALPATVQEVFRAATTAS